MYRYVLFRSVLLMMKGRISLKQKRSGLDETVSVSCVINTIVSKALHAVRSMRAVVIKPTAERGLTHTGDVL